MADLNHPYTVLGIDLGIGSCGFALIDLTNHQILEMGSHLFDVPQTPKEHTSLAVVRRNARHVRRNLKRTRDRQKHCLELLIRHGIVPEGSSKEWLQSVKGDKPVLKLRAIGLSTVLTDRQFAQVLYVLSNRRGYIPHGEGRVLNLDDSNAGTSDAESQKVLAAIKANDSLMAKKAYRTVGEMLWYERTESSPNSGSSRNRGSSYEKCVLHSQIIAEVSAIFEAQRRLGNAKATHEFETAYLSCLSWEKQSLDHDERLYREQVGKCIYFPDEKRAANACYSSELIRAYERLRHLVIVDENGIESRLGDDKVVEYIEVLFSPEPIKGNKNCKVTYSYIRKDLDLSAGSTFKGIDSDREKSEEPFAPRAWRSMRSNGLSSPLLKRMRSDRKLADAIGEALAYASTEESLAERLKDICLDDGDKEAVCALPFNNKVFKGYGNRSLKALDMLLGAFEEPDIKTLFDAEVATGLGDLRLRSRHDRGTLLPPYVAYDPTCNNPVVLRALSRMRRVINAVIRIHGVPDEIHIELAGELKRSAKEKRLIEKRNRENRMRNEHLAKTAGELLGIDPSEVPGKAIRKLAYHEEQGCLDVYSGAPIDLMRLLTDDQYCQIDHVLPYSRTCDDSRANKVLVLTRNNQNKGERTPYEWMTSGEPTAPDWEEFRNRVLAMPNLSRKRRYLLNDSLSQEIQLQFLDRNLNDTRYMSRAAKGWLEDTLLFPNNGKKQHVFAVAGGATAVLRRVWGLNFGVDNEKDRSDSRHHAVDAAVIAACSRRAVQLVALANSSERQSSKRKHEGRLPDTQPWPSFAESVIARRQMVIPTRMVSHGVTGRAFEDTAYGFEGTTEDKAKYSLVHKQGKVYKKGNVVIDKSGSARIVDGIAFLRVWVDPEAKNGKSKGKYYAEPVYYADIPAIANGTYIPRAIEVHVARTSWKPVPDAALKNKPLVLFRGDVLSVDGTVARYWSIDIAGRRLAMRDLRTDEPITSFPSIASWSSSNDNRVICEDCLGHCYEHLEN